MGVVSLALLLGIPLTGTRSGGKSPSSLRGWDFVRSRFSVFPGHFVSLILGTLMVVSGLVLTFVGREPTGIPGWLPSLQSTWHEFKPDCLRSSAPRFAGSSCRCGCGDICRQSRISISSSSRPRREMLPRFPRREKRNDPWPFVGTVGVAATDLLPGGSVEFPIRKCRPTAVVSADEFVPAGAKVVVEDIQGSSIRVRAAT